MRDFALFFECTPCLHRIISLLVSSLRSDELSCSDRKSLFCIIVHTILVPVQLGFLASLPFLVWLPFLVYVGYIAGFVSVNYLVCWQLLNKSVKFEKETDKSPKEVLSYVDEWVQHPKETWIYLNGVSVG